MFSKRDSKTLPTSNNSQLANFSVIIVGGGIGGVTAAHACIAKGVPPKNITILEKNRRLGGMLKTDPATGIDMGGIIASISNPVLQYVTKYAIPVENVLPIEKACLNQMTYGTARPSFCDIVKHQAQFGYQALKFSRLAFTHSQMTTADLRRVGDVSVAEFSKQHNLTALHSMFKPWFTGMGYGDLNKNHYFRMLTYLKYNTQFAPFVNRNPGNYIIRMHGGYQQVVEAMAEDLDVRKKVKITRIDRSRRDSVSVTYVNKENPGMPVELTANLLILATPPQAWGTMGLDLTETEQKCMDVQSSRYPVAICEMEYPPEQVFVPSALEPEGFGHVAFISTNESQSSDTNTRLCTVFMNVHEDDNTFSLAEGSPGRQTLLDDLRALNFGNVTIKATKVWKNYNTRMPFTAGLNLEEEQGNNNTLHATSALSFENVASVIDYVKKIIDNDFKKRFGIAPEQPESIYKSVHTFYSLPRVEPQPRTTVIEEKPAPVRPRGCRSEV